MGEYFISVLARFVSNEGTGELVERVVPSDIFPNGGLFRHGLAQFLC